jgi:hypothetical protein
LTVQGGGINLEGSTMFKAATLARTCLAGLALVVLSASLANAIYGPRTTIGNNYQQTSSTTSPDGTNAGNCNGVATCYVLFQVTPAQKPLIVQHVSCRASISAGGLLYGYLRSRNGQTVPLRRTHLLPVNTTGTWWVVNSPVMHLLESGERPVVFFQNSATANWGNMDCNISGQLKQP